MANNEKRTLSITAVLVDKVSKGLAGISRAISRFVGGASRLFGRLVSLVSPVSLGLTGIATAWASFKGGQTVVEILDGVDALDKLGDSVGTTVDRMSLLRGAFEIAGAGPEVFEQAMKSLSKAVSGVVDKDSAKLIQAFERLGISVTDLRRLDALDLFDQIAAGLERFGTAQERSGALARILPREFQPLFAALANGQEEFRKLITLARMFTGVLSEDGAKAAGRFSDAIDLLRLTMESIGRDAFVKLAEQFAEPLEKLATFLAENRDAIANGLAALVSAIARAAALIGIAFLKLLALITDGLEDLLDALREIPFIGDLLSKSLQKAFNVPDLSDRARELKKEARGIADELVKVEARIAQIRLMPEEMDPSGERGRQLEQQAKDLRNQLAKISMDFASQAPGAGDLMDAAQQGASLRQLSDLLTRLSNFDNLPGLSDDQRGLLQKLLFGKGGRKELEGDITQFFDGFEEQVKQIRDDWLDFGKAGREAANMLVDGGLDGLVNVFADITTGTKTAKEAFRDYARALLSDLAHIIAKLLIMNALQAAFGPTIGVAAARGGVVEGDMGPPQRRFAHGGIASGPTWALFGEGNRREAFVPLPDNRSIPVTLTGGAGSATIVNLNVTAMDSRDVKRLLYDERATIGALIREQIGGGVSGGVAMRHALQQAGR